MSENSPNFPHPVWIRQRELGQQLPLGHSDVFHKSLYSSIKKCHSLAREEDKPEHGGLFALDFSPDGSLLVAGCEKQSLLVFDPLSQRMIHSVDDAHERSVTSVKFLDSRIFATGSADRTVLLWDVRNLKSQIRTLQGHANTIEDIDFSQKHNLLITSGLDGIIYTCDLNIAETKFSRKIFDSYVLMRFRLNPDESKMIISTVRGYLIIVHDLDLNTLALGDVNSDRIEIMYLNQPITATSLNSSRFLFPNRRRNRVEIVTDFPNPGGFNVISALEIHPQGRSAFSRSTSAGDEREWTCVHDVQETGPSGGTASPQGGSGDESPPRSGQNNPGSAQRHRRKRTSEGYCSPRGNVVTNESASNELPCAAFTLGRRGRKRRLVSPADTARGRSPPPGHSTASPNTFEPVGLRSDTAFSRLVDPSLSRPNSSVSQLKRKVNVPFPRLTHYIEESNSSDWYIENMCVSADGRVLCSPFGPGIRLLSFSPDCCEHYVTLPEAKPYRLHELKTYISHSKSVVCTKFSPRHCLLVSGCLGGNLVWYQPVL